MIQQRSNRLLLAALCLQICTSGMTQSSWKMQPVVLQTRWAKEVHADKPLNEYPRPQLQRKNWTNMNGLWDYAITEGDATPEQYAGKILVPYPLESALSGVKKTLLPAQRLWYRRMFSKPPLKDHEKLLLNFGAVDYQCWVYVNGISVGEHEGGYTAFSVDITHALTDGDNTIVVKVYDPTDQGIGPHGKQVLNPANIYYTPSSGIWQTVWMETVPEDYITDLKTSTNIDKSFVHVLVETADKDENTRSEATVFFNGKLIAKETATSNSIGINIPDAKLWSPDAPNLYTLQVRTFKKAKLLDEVHSYFGMRKVEIKKDSAGFDRIFLNNKYTYNLGVLDQGFWPDGLYTAPTDEALAFDIKAIKAMGFNTIRKHIKVEPARWYYHADKTGMMVWQDFVNPNQGLPAGAKKAFEEQARETMDQLRNYPSITTWVLFNERWGAYDQERLTQWAKEYDPSRLVNGHSGELLYVNQKLRDTSDNAYIGSDLVDYHSYPDPMEIKSLPGKASVLGEFGGIGVSVPAHQWDDLQGWGYVQVTANALKTKYDSMVLALQQLETKGLSASIYTQPFDVEGEENGLLTYDRDIIKIPLADLRKTNSQLVKLSKGFTLDPKFYVAKNIDVNDNDSRYEVFIKQFESGKKDSAFLRRLTLMAMRKKDQKRAAEVSRAYIDQLKFPLGKNNLIFIRQITRSSADRGFEIFLKDSARINKIFGDYWAQSFLMDIIAREYIGPSLASETMQPDWNSISNTVVSKFGELGRERLYMEQLSYYWLKLPNPDSLAKYYVLYFDMALPHSRLHVNNVSWSIFKYVTDPAILAYAIKVMQYDLEHFDPTNVEAYDTYANLLYKAGRKEEAITWEEKAYQMKKGAYDEAAYAETLEKMKKGEKTWP